METVDVALRLRTARESAGLTREQAAVKAGVSTSTLQMWETTPPIQLGTLTALARIYHCSIDSLLHITNGNGTARSRVKVGKDSK